MSVGFFAFASLNQPNFILFSAIFHIRSRHNLSVGMVTLGLLYVGCDWIAPKLFHDSLGHALFEYRLIRQTSDLAGVWYLTFLIFSVNYSLYQILRVVCFHFAARIGRGPLFSSNRGLCAENPRVHWVREAIRYTLLPSLLIAFSSVYGKIRIESLRASHQGGSSSLTFAVVQANITSEEKLRALSGDVLAAQRIVSQYLALSDKALRTHTNIQLLIWPETAYPFWFGSPIDTQEQINAKRLQDFINKREISLLYGGFFRDGEREFNGVFLRTPSDKLEKGRSGVRVYKKSILLPFAEYMPGSPLSRFLGTLVHHEEDFDSGAGSVVFPLSVSPQHQVMIAPTVCYESLFPSYVRLGVRQGAQVLVNLSDDSWFNSRAQTESHLALAVFRSIENRIPQIRANNSGISALVNHDGEILHFTKSFRTEILVGEIQAYSPHGTLFYYLGDWFGPFALIVGILSFVCAYRNSSKLE